MAVDETRVAELEALVRGFRATADRLAGAHSPCSSRAASFALDLLPALFLAYLVGSEDAGPITVSGSEDPGPAPERELSYDEDNPGRWELGFRNIVTYVQGPRAPFDVPGIVEKVRVMRELEERRARTLDHVTGRLAALESELSRSESYAMSSRQDEDMLKSLIEALTTVRIILNEDTGLC